MPNYPLTTHWGGSHHRHPPIILNPRNSQSDLVLTSEVQVQQFLSLQQHEYHYKAENNSHASGANCSMRVDWRGPKITWAALSPGRIVDIAMLSFFSPQRLQTTANVDVLAGHVPIQSRNVAGEQADAYVTWTASIAGGLRELWSIFKDVLSTGKTISTYASVSSGDGQGIEILSWIEMRDQFVHYLCSVSNRMNLPIRGEIHGLFGAQSISNFELDKGGQFVTAHRAQELPDERSGVFKYNTVEATGSQYNVLPIPLLVPTAGQ